MKDSNQMIHYLGFESIANGGRRLQFSIGPSTEIPILLTVSIAGAFFAGSERVSFQEAPGICRNKLRENLDSGTLHHSSKPIELTTNDVAQYREVSRRRRS